MLNILFVRKGLFPTDAYIYKRCIHYYIMCASVTNSACQYTSNGHSPCVCIFLFFTVGQNVFPNSIVCGVVPLFDENDWKLVCTKEFDC